MIRTVIDAPVEARPSSDPLGPHAEAFEAHLADEGYASRTSTKKKRVVQKLGRWLERSGLELEDLDEQRVAEFLQHSKPKSGSRQGDAATMRSLLVHLRSKGALASPEPATDESAVKCVEHAFAQYLLRERGLSPGTLNNYLAVVDRFLTECFDADETTLHFDDLTQQHICAFVLGYARATSPNRAKLVVAALRGLLRFLRLRGDLTTDLAASVPSVADWKHSTLPKALAPEQVELVLRSCDRCHAMGQRDYAVLALLARLGLRAGEIVALSLDDIDWDTGVLTVHGKGGQRDRLPIPQEVGEALAAYLREGRPCCASRRVFIRIRAPHKGLASSVAICMIVRRALARAKLDPPRRGSHLFRHGLATEMLRRGASLSEIGEVLRHRAQTSTEIYAKVDLEALRALAAPWPGGDS